jgi:hypothetical protein
VELRSRETIGGLGTPFSGAGSLVAEAAPTRCGSVLARDGLEDEDLGGPTVLDLLGEPS